MTVWRELSRYVRFSGSAGSQMGGRWHKSCWRIHIFLLKGERESYQQLRDLSLLVIGCHIIITGRWCHIIGLNVHAPTEDKTDDVKGSLCVWQIP
jgi:hypothetical protein